MHKFWRAKRQKVYSRKGLFWHYRLQLSFIYKIVSIFFFFFCIVDKDSIRFREEVSLISWTWFTFPQKSRFKINISKKIHKIETRFWEERVMIAMVSLPLQNPCTFFVAKEENWKRIFKTKVNDPKIIQKIIYAIQSNSKLGI